MATGMVLVIVTRNIDLSVGSIVGFIGMIMGVAQAEFLLAVSRLRSSEIRGSGSSRWLPACCSAC